MRQGSLSDRLGRESGSEEGRTERAATPAESLYGPVMDVARTTSVLYVELVPLQQASQELNR